MKLKKKLNRILLVENDETTIYVLEKYLRLMDIVEEVDSAFDGQDAIKFLKELEQRGHQPPELILLDINMPGVDGYQFLDLLRKSGLASRKKSKIIMLSSSMRKEDKKRAEQYEEVVDYMIKPLEDEDLQKMLNHF